MLIIAMLLGLLIGSFLNVLIYRIPRGEDFVFSRSHCTSCGYVLRWYDLVPVITYISLGGKCRKCKNKISIMYPLIEVINSLMYGFIYYRFGYSVYTLVCMLMFSILLVISVIDFKDLIIPNQLVIAILLIAACYSLYDGNYLSHIIGFFVVSLVLLIINIITKGGIGMGDVKLMAVGGLLLGISKILASFVIGSVVAGIAGIILLLLKKASRESKIPFGPFLAFGIMTVLLFGDEILDIYLGLLI